MAEILLIEAFYGGSHKQLIDLLCTLPRHVLFTLPAKKWHWRARTAALYFSQTIPASHTYRVLFTSSVLNLVELVALRPDLAALRKVLYFHENQLIYPIRKHQERDFQYGYNQILSCLVADEVIFNSHYNKDSFLSNIQSFMSLIPDHRPTGLVDAIRPKCRVIYFPLCVPEVSRSLDSAEKLTSLNEDSQKLTSLNDDSQKLTSLNDDSQKLVSLNEDSQKLTSLNDNQKLTSLNDDSQKLASDTVDDDSKMLTFDYIRTSILKPDAALNVDSAVLISENSDSGSTAMLISEKRVVMTSNKDSTDNCAVMTSNKGSTDNCAVMTSNKGSTDNCVVMTSNKGSTDNCVVMTSNKGSTDNCAILTVYSALNEDRPILMSNSALSDTGKALTVSADGVHEISSPSERSVLHIVWAHRWEHDKDPATFFNVLYRLQDEGYRFIVSVIGQCFTQVPDVFLEAKKKLSSHIVNWGFQKQDNYYSVLRRADVSVSTALHEFFGVAINWCNRLWDSACKRIHCCFWEREAHVSEVGISFSGMLSFVSCSACVPRNIPSGEPSYTTHSGSSSAECLYRTKNQLFKKLKTFCIRPHIPRRSKPVISLDRFSWDHLKNEYEVLLKFQSGPSLKIH